MKFIKQTFFFVYIFLCVHFRNFDFERIATDTYQLLVKTYTDSILSVRTCKQGLERLKTGDCDINENKKQSSSNIRNFKFSRMKTEGFVQH